MMEFLPDVSLRLCVALLLGGLIGIEREYRAKEAGFRTHFLVAMGSALFCVVSQYGFGEGVKDASRVAAQVVSGIGFLGAGTIIFQKNVVRGLTTAAGLWVTAAIGLACGTGLYAVALVATLLMLTGLEVLNAFVPALGTTTVVLSFVAKEKESVKRVVEQIRGEGMELFSYELKAHHDHEGDFFEATLELRVKRSNSKERLIEFIGEFDDVTISSIE